MGENVANPNAVNLSISVIERKDESMADGHDRDSNYGMTYSGLRPPTRNGKEKRDGTTLSLGCLTGEIGPQKSSLNK